MHGPRTQRSPDAPAPLPDPQRHGARSDDHRADDEGDERQCTRVYRVHSNAPTAMITSTVSSRGAIALRLWGSGAATTQAASLRMFRKIATKGASVRTRASSPGGHDLC
jgi:hypothetical protein